MHVRVGRHAGAPSRPSGWPPSTGSSCAIPRAQPELGGGSRPRARAAGRRGASCRGAAPRRRGSRSGDVLAGDRRPAGADALEAAPRGAAGRIARRAAVALVVRARPASACQPLARREPKALLRARRPPAHDRPRHQRDPLRDRGRPARTGASSAAPPRSASPGSRTTRAIRAGRSTRLLARAAASRPRQIDLVALAGARRGVARVAEPRAPRRGLRAGVLRRDLAVAAPRASRRRCASRAPSSASSTPRAASSASPSASGSAAVTEHLGVAAGAHRVPRSPHLPRRRRLLRLGLRRAGEALVLTNDNSGDGLCATASTGRGLELERHEATPSAPGLGRGLLLVRDARARHEVRRARVQGDGPGAVRAGAVRGARGGGAARGLRPRGGPAGALPLAHAGRALPAPPARHCSGCASTRSRAAPSDCSRTCCCAGAG